MESSLAAVADRVYFAGKISQELLPCYFAIADLFFFPSRHDGWAVVINEACGAGLPIVTTYSTGAAWDLVEHGRNGYVLDRDDCDGFVSALDKLVADASLRCLMGEQSRLSVQSLRPALAAQRWLDHVQELSNGSAANQFCSVGPAPSDAQE